MNEHSPSPPALVVVDTCVLCGHDDQPVRHICVSCLGSLIDEAESKADSNAKRRLPKLLTVPQAADFLNVGPRTVRRLIAVGKLAAVPVGTASSKHGVRYRVRYRDLRRLLDEGAAPSTDT